MDHLIREARKLSGPMPVNGWKYLGHMIYIQTHKRLEFANPNTALGKKNWLFFGDADAGERSAIIYSIIESCRRP